MNRQNGYRALGGVRGGRYRRNSHSTYDSSHNVHVYNETDSSLAATGTSPDTHLSVPAVSVFDTHRQTWKHGRGNRRSWRANGSHSHRPDLAPANDSVDVNIEQPTSMYAAGVSTNVASNCERNAGQYGRGEVSGGIRRRLGSRHSHGRGRGYNPPTYSAFKEPASLQPQTTQNTGSLMDSSVLNAANSANACLSPSLTRHQSAAERTFMRGRRNRRPYTGGNSRPFSVEFASMSDCSSSQQVEDQQQWSANVASTDDCSESVDVDVSQTHSIHASGVFTMASKHGRNTRQQRRGRFVHGTRRQNFMSRKSQNQQSNSLSCVYSDTECPVVGSDSAQIESRMHDQLETVSNAESGEWNDEESDVHNATNVLVTDRGKHKPRNSRPYRSRVCGNRRGHNRAREVFGSVRASISNKTADEESEASYLPEELEASSAHDYAGDSDEVVKTQAAGSEMKQVVNEPQKNSMCRPTIDENSLFWHLVNKHDGQCCIDELRDNFSQLNTLDADEAIAILRVMRRVKVLVNDSDKWMSVVFVFLKGLRMCLSVRAGCRKKNCPYFHLCPDHITRSCHAGQHCRLNHDVRTSQNELCLQKCGIPDSCSSESVLTIARSSNLVICANHNGIGESQCRKPFQCVRFHVCNNFFRKRCLIPDSECSLGHELTSQHNARLLPLYEVQHLLEGDKLKTLYQMLLPSNTDIFACSQARISREDKAQLKSAQCEPTGLVDLSPDSPSVPLLTSIHKSQRPFTLQLQRFDAGRGPVSKTSDVFASVPATKSARDECNSSSNILSAKCDLAASTQSSKHENADKKFSQPLSNESKLDLKMAEMTKTVLTSRPVGMRRSSIRRSESARTLGFQANQCQSYVKHVCSVGSECSVRHGPLPYLWHVQDAGQWFEFDNNVSIELAFCDPNNTYVGATYQVCIYPHCRNMHMQLLKILSKILLACSRLQNFGQLPLLHFTFVAFKFTYVALTFRKCHHCILIIIAGMLTY